MGVGGVCTRARRATGFDSYYEVDLIDLLGREDGDEAFRYFWVFFRRAALERQPNAFVDRVRSQSEELAEGLSARVKGRVYEALGLFINGFFAFAGNGLDPAPGSQGRL